MLSCSVCPFAFDCIAPNECQVCRCTGTNARVVKHDRVSEGQFHSLLCRPHQVYDKIDDVDLNDWTAEVTVQNHYAFNTVVQCVSFCGARCYVPDTQRKPCSQLHTFLQVALTH